MIILALLSVIACQDEGRKEWEGFGEGSSAVLRLTVTDGAKQESEVVRYSIVKVAADAVTVRIETQGRGSKEQAAPLKKDESLKKTGTESVDIDGKTFSCSVYEKSVETGKKKLTTKIWMSKDVPGRIAKQELTEKNDLEELKTVGQLTRLDQKTTIAGKAVTYAVWEMTNTSVSGSEATSTRWISEQVPGFIVREELRAKQGGTGKEKIRVTELVEFETK